MINSAWILAKKDFRSFVRDRIALLLSILVPIALVSVFGWIMAYAFGGSGGMPKVTLHVFDQNGSEASVSFVDGLKSVDMIRVRMLEMGAPKTDEETSEQPLLSNETVNERLKGVITNGDAHHILWIPANYSELIQAGEKPQFQMLRDPGRGMEDQIVKLAIAQASISEFGGSVFTDAMEGLLVEQGMDAAQVDSIRGWMNSIGSTVESFAQMSSATSQGSESESEPESETSKAADASPTKEATKSEDADSQEFGLDSMMEFMSRAVPMETTDVKPPSRARQVTYQQAQSVAGMSVMMLLFALTSCGSVLLKEREDGTLKRLFCQPISRNSILLGKFFFLFIVGIMQLTILFCYGEWLFRVGLFRDPITLVVLSLTWIATGGAFGMFLAAVSRSSKQAESLASLLILMMAALGGCWFPLQMMNLPPVLETVCKSTMTYWAMAGYQGMLWNQLAWYSPKLLEALAWQWGWVIVFTALSIFFYRRNYCRG